MLVAFTDGVSEAMNEHEEEWEEERLIAAVREFHSLTGSGNHCLHISGARRRLYGGHQAARRHDTRRGSGSITDETRSIGCYLHLQSRR